MTLKLLQVDTFTTRPLGGNPAAVVPLEKWLPVPVMQAIANENNLSETAFFAPRGAAAEPGAEDATAGGLSGDAAWELRWFTPNSEVALCGHATLAAGYVVLEGLAGLTGSTGDESSEAATFATQSGTLTVARGPGGLFVMDFPSQPAAPCANPPADLIAGLGAGGCAAPESVVAGADYIAVYKTPEEVAALAPDLTALMRIDRRGVVATAPGTGLAPSAAGDPIDYVLRFFAPKNAVPEDPVTGNVQTAVVPYWAARLGQSRLAARQLSARGGEMVCEDQGARVTIAGHAALFMDATIEI